MRIRTPRTKYKKGRWRHQRTVGEFKNKLSTNQHHQFNRYFLLLNQLRQFCLETWVISLLGWEYSCYYIISVPASSTAAFHIG
jgi:hypothetical protein